jgi:hypothetical protein
MQKYVLLYCSAAESRKLKSLDVGKFEKPCCLRNMKHYIHANIMHLQRHRLLEGVTALFGKKDGVQQQKLPVAA